VHQEAVRDPGNAFHCDKSDEYDAGVDHALNF
jgi:hypothetical protein